MLKNVKLSLDSRSRRYLKACIISLSVFFLLTFLLFYPKQTFAADFDISNTSPFLGEEITIEGTNLIANHEYYILLPEAGPSVDYSDTTYQGRTSKQFTADSTFGHVSYFSVAFEEYDNILFHMSYYDAAPSARYFRLGAGDIYWDNGGGAVENVDIISSGSNGWVDYYHLFDKANAIQDFGWKFIKLNGFSVYFDEMAKIPVWLVTTDNDGNFTKTLHAPRRVSLNDDLDFTYEIFNPSDNAQESIAA
jgi:hypothetical protein